ncbi:MAG: hypothetical protein ABID71_03870 [Chloroflexota bacterium]
MAETKYDKYFIRGPKPGETRPAFLDAVAYLDDDVIKGSFYFNCVYIRPDHVPRVHGPHTHPHPEVLGYFGIDPDHPFELGAEIELSMGEELEKHVFTQSTLVFIPPGLVHCPIRYNKIERPFIFMYSMPVKKLLEKSYKHLVPEDERDAMVFFDT